MRHILAICLLAFPFTAFAAGLDNPNEIDIVRIAATTGQLSLYVVLDERILSRASAGKLYKKLNQYAKYVRSGQAFKDEPKARSELPAIFVIMVPKPSTEAEMQNLTGIKNDFAGHGFTVNIEPFEPPKNRAAKPTGT